MRINCNVELRPDENLNDMSPAEAASAVINALGGDEEIDYCVVTTRYEQASGTAGLLEAPPPPGQPE